MKRKCALLVLLLGVIFIGLGAKCPWQKDKDDDPVSGSSGSAPSAPSSLLLGADYGSVYYIIWADNSPDEDGFKIEEMFVSQDVWILVKTVGANTTSVGFNAKASGDWRYRVYAWNQFGSSTYSNTVTHRAD